MWIRSFVWFLTPLLTFPLWAQGQTNVFRSAYRGSLPSTGPAAVGVGDFDGDGALEIVAASSGTTNRELTFCRWFPATDPPPGIVCDSGRMGPSFPSALTVDDFDDDGQVDLLVASAGGNSVVFMKGRGDDEMVDPPGPSTAVGVNPRDIAVGQLGGDAALDVAVANEGSSDSAPGSVSVLLGQGDGSFDLCRTLGAEPGTAAVVIGDLNDDQKPDVAAVNSRAESISVWLATGNCDFMGKVPVVATAAPLDLALGDLDEDGNADLATADNNDDRVSIFFGRGDGTFEAPVFHTVGTAPSRVEITDLDDDGHLDMLATNVRSGDVSTLFGDGRGGFTPARNFVADAQPRAIALGDVDENGLLDVVTVVDPEISQVAMLTNPGGRSLVGVEDLSAGVQPEDVATGDADNDGYSDLLTPSVDGKVVLLRSNPAGGFRRPQAINIGGRPFSVAASDLNGDDRLDLAVADRAEGQVAVRLGVGGGAFGPVRRFSVALEPAMIVAGDFNGDGRGDLAVTAGGVTGQVSVLLQTASGSFGPARDTMVENTPVGIGVGDFNADGRDDLVVANQASQTVSVLRSNGNGTFTTSQTLPPAAVGQATAIAVADFNGDLRPDFAVTDFGFSRDNVRLLLGNGDATFRSGQALRAGDQPRAIVARDVTGDQRVDLVVVNQVANAIQVVAQGADGSFASLPRSGIDVVSRMPVAIAAADLDGDGRYDAATANNDPNSNNVSVLLNCTRDPECSTRTPIPGAAALRGDVNGDGAVSAADFALLAVEVTDGDGEEVEDIARVGVAAAPGVDANGDGRVDSQDRVAVAHWVFRGDAG